MPNSSIWPIDRTLSGSTALGNSGPGSDGNKGVLHIPQSSNITGASSSDVLESSPGQLLGEFYPSAEMQSVYSIALNDWGRQWMGGSTFTWTLEQVSHYCIQFNVLPRTPPHKKLPNSRKMNDMIKRRWNRKGRRSKKRIKMCESVCYLQLWANSWADWDLSPWCDNQYWRRKTLNSTSCTLLYKLTLYYFLLVEEGLGKYIL